jgi:S1-C subfamily serine protease
MSADLQDSIFLVTSSDPDNHQFGTAFAFYSGEDANGHNEATYFLTCRHVVTDVGGLGQVRIGSYPAQVVASGSEGSLDDIAVLRVDGLQNVPILRLNTSAQTGSPVKVLGFQQFEKSSAQNVLFRPLQAKLGEQLGLESKRESGRVAAWDLTIEGDYDLERGYSGGPVIDGKSGEVVGVASYRLGGR